MKPAVRFLAAIYFLSLISAVGCAQTVSSVVLSPNPIFSRQSGTGTVTLSEAVDTSETVKLSAGAGASCPTSVTIPAGATSATFPFTAAAVTSQKLVVIKASLGSSSVSVTLVIEASALTTISAASNVSPAGTTLSGTVTLAIAAPSGGFTIHLSSNQASVTVPATVTVPANAKSANFSIAVGWPNGPVQATITATDPNKIGLTTSFSVLPSCPFAGLYTGSVQITGGTLTLSNNTYTFGATGSQSCIATVEPSGHAHVSWPAIFTWSGGNYSQGYALSITYLTSDFILPQIPTPQSASVKAVDYGQPAPGYSYEALWTCTPYTNGSSDGPDSGPRIAIPTATCTAGQSGQAAGSITIQGTASFGKDFLGVSLSYTYVITLNPV